MVDLDAAIGFVIAKGDPLDRARLSWLRAGVLADESALAHAISGQTLVGGWPMSPEMSVPSIDATCFRLAQLDDLGAITGPAARAALDWLASVQRYDGTWQETDALADHTPPWLRPGDPEATLYLTANVAYWLTVADMEARAATPYGVDGSVFTEPLARAAGHLQASINPDGTWPSYLVAGWLSASVLYRRDMFYESARIQVVLSERMPGMTAADAAACASALSRVGVAEEDFTLLAARKRLGETQRTDGGWPSDDGEAFDVHVTLQAIRAFYKQQPPEKQ